MQSRALNHGMGLLLKGKKWLGKKVPQRGLGKTQGLGGGRQAEAEKSEFSWEPRHCSVLSHILIHSGLPGSYEVGVSSPSSPVTHEKVRRTGVKTLAQGHTASKCLMVKDERVFFLPLLLLLLFFFKNDATFYLLARSVEFRQNLFQAALSLPLLCSSLKTEKRCLFEPFCSPAFLLAQAHQGVELACADGSW